MLITRRAAVVLAAGAAAVLAVAGPAAAHVDVDAEPARALATDALVTMTAAAESSTAGITGVRIQLPAALPASGVRLASGPDGWRLTVRNQVLDIRGPALPVDRSLRLALRVRQLPAASQLVLKTVQSYSDGRQDSWIEVPAPGAPEPDAPAPVLRLAPAAPGATPLPRATPTAAAPAPSSSAAGPAPSTAAPTAAAATAPPAEDPDGGSNAVWLFAGAGIGALLLGGVVLAARKGAGASPGR